MSIKNLKNPKISDLIDEKWNKEILPSLNFALPATIVSFEDGTEKTCTVRPDLKIRYRNGDIVDRPFISGVPIVFPQSSDSMISFPLKEGDGVLLVFSQRSLDDWKIKDTPLLPSDFRKFDISDAIAIPGLFRKGKGLPVSKDFLLIQNGILSQKMYDDGKIEIENSTNELISAINELTEELKNFSQEVSNITTLVMGTPTPPINQPQLALYVAKFQLILTKFETFKK